MRLRALGRAVVAALLLWCAAARGQDPEPATPEPAPPGSRPSPTPPPATAPANTTPAETQPSTPQADLPSAKDIINRCIEAMGGEAAFDAIRSSTIDATLGTETGDLPLEMKWMRPNMVLLKQQLPEGISTMGCDGTVTWMQNQLGFKILTAADARAMCNEATIFLTPLRMRDDTKSVETVGEITFDEARCYKIRFVDEEDVESFAFFDVDHHLIRGIESPHRGPLTMKFSDWKEDGGVKYFSRLDIEQAGATRSLTFTNVKFNTLEPSVFALPDEVRAMLKEQELPASQPATMPSPEGG